VTPTEAVAAEAAGGDRRRAEREPSPAFGLRRSYFTEKWTFFCMKMGRLVALYCFVVVATALAKAEPVAKQLSSSARTGDLLPPADQWNSLPKEAGEIHTLSISSDGHEEEGSGDDDDDDYYWDDDDYYELGSGHGRWDWGDEDDLETEKTSKGEKTVQPTATVAPVDDIHFEEENNGHNSSRASDTLYEYYNEFYDEHDYEEDGIDLDNEEYDDDDDNDADYESVAPTIGAGDKSEGSIDNGDNNKLPEAAQLPILRASHIYVMLASAIISFALGFGLFLLCRRSAFAKEEKRRHTGPFLVTDHRKAAAAHPTPIVKSYQKVPTSTREYMDPPGYHSTVDMTGKSKKPLLA